MDFSVNKLRSSMRLLQELLLNENISAADNKVLEEFHNVTTYTEKHIERLLSFLCKKFIDNRFTTSIAIAFEEYLLLIVTSVMNCDEEVNADNFGQYQRKCIALSKIISFSTDVKRYSTSFFRSKPAPFAVPEQHKMSIRNKKGRFEEDSNGAVDDFEIIKCCYNLLIADPVFYKELWNWSTFVEVLVSDEKTNELKQVYANNIIAFLTNMSPTQLSKLNQTISAEILLQFHLESNPDIQMREKAQQVYILDTKDEVISIDFCSDYVTNIEGVLLPIFNKDNYKFYKQTDGSYDKIVKVDSTKVNLRSIGMGIESGKAICLSGPVGCGKTTLVEYLARKTGHICPKPAELQNVVSGKENLVNGNIHKEPVIIGNKRKSNTDEINNDFDMDKDSVSQTNGFLRIQLGDQTDSKMLLGQYRCTDVPGEFIWLPGVLTQAVMNGFWLLLEDLDSATQDTYMILSSLLENKFLSVPGFRDCVKIEPGFQLFVTVRTNKSSINSVQKSVHSLLEKYLYTVNILPLSRNELCKVVSTNYPKLSTVANRIVDVFLTFSSGNHTSADNLRRQETQDKADTGQKFVQLPCEELDFSIIMNSGRCVSTRDLIKLCQRSSPMFSVTSAECAYFVFQNAVDLFCSYLPQSIEKTKLITSIGAKLGIIRSRCEHYADVYKPEAVVDNNQINVGRAKLIVKEQVNPFDKSDDNSENFTLKRQKLTENSEKILNTLSMKKSGNTFSFTRMASCILERIAVCVLHAEPVLLVGETGVGKTSSVQYLAERTQHKLVVVNMNNQSDVSDLVGGFKPVDLIYILAPLRFEFEALFRKTFNQIKNESFLNKFCICYNQGNFPTLVTIMHNICLKVFGKADRNELKQKELDLLPQWEQLKVKLIKLKSQLAKSINISFAFIPGSLVNCIKNGDWVLLDEINLASAETLECLSTILEPDGSVILLEKGDFMPVKRHPDFRIFACMNPNTDIGKKDLSVGIRNRFTEFFVDELTTDSDLTLLISDYLGNTGIQRKSVTSIVKLYKKLKVLSRLELNDGLGNRPVFSLRTLCRSLRICAKNLCGSIERNLYESFCMSFLTQLDPVSHNIVINLIKEALLSNPKVVLNKAIPSPGEDYLNFEGYWIQQGPNELQECEGYILTDSVKENLKDLSRIISIGKLPILLQGPTSAGKTSLIQYVAKKSGNHCLRINNHEHTDLQEYIGTYTADVSGKLSFQEGVLVQAMRNGYWIILDELNLASSDILEALNRVLDDNRELFIPETQKVVKAHPNFMLFATQNPPGLYGGRKTLSRAFKNRFIELHFSDIPRKELEIILEKRCLIPTSYAKKMVSCMTDLQKHRKSTSKNVFTLRDLFRWGNRYTFADKNLLNDSKYDWNQHLIEEGYLVLSAKVRTEIEIEIIEETLYKNFKKRIGIARLFDINAEENSPVTKGIIDDIRTLKRRSDIVWTRNMTRMAVLTAKALQFDEPVLLVGPTGCGKTTVCQILADIRGVQLRILNCHMHTEGADFLGGLRPCRENSNENNKDNTQGKKLFEWADGPLIYAMQEGSYFMADEISLAEDSVLERLNCILEPERTVLLAEKGGVTGEVEDLSKDFIIQAKKGFQFLGTMNPGGDFGKKELSPALRNRFTEIWCQPSDTKEDLIQIAGNCMLEHYKLNISKDETMLIAKYLIEVVFHMRNVVEKFKFSIRDILAWANYIVSNSELSFAEKAIFGLETVFLDALEMLPHESLQKVEMLKNNIKNVAVKEAEKILNENFTLLELESKRGTKVIQDNGKFGIKPFFIDTNTTASLLATNNFLFEAPTTKSNLFRLLSALSLKKPVLLEGPPGVGKTSIVESITQAIGFNIVRINLCEHTDLADLFGTDLPAEDNILGAEIDEKDSVNTIDPKLGAFVWRDGPLLAALKAQNTWILLDELNLAPQSVLEGLNAILDHRGEVYIPELNKTFLLSNDTRIFACQNPLKQGGGRKGLPQSFLNRFNKVYLRKLSTEDLLYVVNGKFHQYFEQLRTGFAELLQSAEIYKANLFDLYKASNGVGVDTAEGARISAADVTFDLAARLVKFSETLDKGIAAMEFGYRGGPYEINLRDILRWCDLLVNPQTGFTFKLGSNTSNSDLFQRNFELFLLILYERMKLVYYQRMRCDQDKAFIRNAFGKVFNCDADRLNALSEDVALYWTEDKLYLNDIVLDREYLDESMLIMQQKHSCPLLLVSQREILKNLIECVHMEKPVLLSAPTDTGKTKLIDALCIISNQVCNTDQIDDSVTGSFQQVDLNRHLEVISQNVENLLLRYIQDSIFEKVSGKVITKLLNSWSNYSRLANHKPELGNFTDTSKELNAFRQRVQLLSLVIEELEQATILTTTVGFNKAKLQQQQNLLVVLTNYIRYADTLNTGGSFEWIDSKIVKSLKIGQYILLEHVNLCSSAILDRLNPVFEPNGKLLISEKGISADDSAEIVKKSDNFRAFLTTDPKNGELSRAMRNRCIELSLPKDYYTTDDMRMIVYTQGVRAINDIESILNIHKRIVHLTEINNYNISHLTQFAFLVASYKRIGYDTQRAIYVSGMEVYVYSANTDLLGHGLTYYQNKLREIVLESTKFAEEQIIERKEDHLANVILYCSQLDEITMIKLQTEALKILLDMNERKDNNLSLLFKEFKEIDFTCLDNKQLVQFFIYILYETSTIKDVKLRFLYLKNVLSEHKELQHLSEVLHNTIDLYKTNVTVKLHNLPWNMTLFPRIRDYTSQIEESGTTNVYSFNLSSLLILELLLDSVPNEEFAHLYEANAFTYSKAIATEIFPDKFNNKLLLHLSTFLTNLTNTLKSVVNKTNIDIKTFVMLQRAVLYYNRLLFTAKQNLFINKQLNKDLIDKLVLHFKWLNKHLLSHFEELHTGTGQQQHATYETSLQGITDYIDNVKHSLVLTRKLYTKEMTQFQPLFDLEQVQFNAITDKCDKLLSVIPSYGSLSAAIILKKFNAQKSSNARQLHALLHQYQHNKFDYNFKEILTNHTYGNELPEELKSSLQEFNIEINNANPQTVSTDFSDINTKLRSLEEFISTEESTVDESIKEMELSVICLKEYYLLKALLSDLNNSSIGDRYKINELYYEQLHSLSNVTRQFLKLNQTEKYKSFHKIWYHLEKYINNISNSDEFERLLKYLNSGYKSISTFKRLVSSAVNDIQLNSLATRFSVVQTLSSGAEAESLYSYEGPYLLNILIHTVFQNDGSLKPVPLQDLELWKHTLSDINQLIWQNSHTMSTSSALLINNYASTTKMATKLLNEMTYIEKLCASKETESATDYNIGYKKLKQMLTDAQVNMVTSADVDFKHISIKYCNIQYQTSYVNALIGAIELCLLTYAPLIDPVEKNRLKHLYIVEDINSLTTMSTVYDFMRIIMHYKHFGADIYAELEAHLGVLKDKEQKFIQKVALRPAKCLYSALIQDIKHFLSTNCEPKSLCALIENASHSWHNLTSDVHTTKSTEAIQTCTESLNKIKLWIANSQHFINHILKPYADYYQDFLQPIKCAVEQLRFGFEGLRVVLTQVNSAFMTKDMTHEVTNINKEGKLHKVLTNIVTFPAVETLNIFNVHSSRDIFANRAAIFSILEKLPNSELVYFQLLKAKLSELRNIITISENINEANFTELDFAFNICNQIWQSEEERRRKQKIEEESIYVTKTKCATEDEELLELKEIEEYFPTNVEEDFGEFMLEDTLEKVIKLEKKQDLKTKSLQIIREDDYAFLGKYFISVMTYYTRIHYHKPNLKELNKINLEILTPFKQRLNVFVSLFTQYKNCLNDVLDDNAYNSFAFLIGLQQKMLRSSSLNDEKSTRTYNFYKDSNLSEILTCTDVLSRIEVRVIEQLELYPEHASLIDIKCVIERIRLLPSTSPVARFNTGFQLLRQKVSQWNEVAHKNNNLRDEEIEVAEFVQKWMKLELQFWRNCLDQTYEKIESQAYKYWFFIYNLIQEFILDHEVDSTFTQMKYAEKRFAEGEILDQVDIAQKSKVTASEIIQILRQFVEVSCYGDFHIRMQLLQAFELYLHNIDKNSVVLLTEQKRLELISGLHNLQLYFSQFATEIEESATTMRAPIEKKLKELVKIESYNKDLSYFSMRSNVARVHRNLNKFLKEYQSGLQQKITPVFQPKDATVKDYNFENEKGKDLRYDSRMKYYLQVPKLFVAAEKLGEKYASQSISAEGEKTLLNKVVKHFSTARNVVKETVTNAVYSKLIVALDIQLCKQLENCEHLRSLTVDRSKERPKQILEAKQILQQKRKGLTDLFKTLQQLGISYKSGLMELSFRTEFEDYTLPPFCIKTMLNAFKERRLPTCILHLNENLDKYFAKCVFKLRLLQNIMLTPLSELGLPNIERMKGNAVGLFLLAQEQRQLLAKTTKNIYDLHAMLQQIKNIAEIISPNEVNNENLDFTLYDNTYQALKDAVSRVLYVYEQFKLLLNCAPSDNSDVHNVITNDQVSLLQSSPHLSKVNTVIDMVMQIAKNTLRDMNKMDGNFLSFVKLKEYQSAHTELIELTKQIIDILKSIQSGEYLPMAKPLIELLEAVAVIPQNTQNVESLASFENINNELENILHVMLLALQKLYKKHPKPNLDKSTDTNKTDDSDNLEDEAELQEQHLKKKLHGELIEDWEILNMSTVIEKLSNILTALKHAEPTQQKKIYLNKVVTILPILEQHNLLAEFYLCQQLGAHKITAKMLSVMLTVFIEISTKGFCVPADLMQDEEGESKKDQKEGEGFGLEDGTGEKDASDKIESEDQLEDAKRPEDRKDDDDKQQEDCKEEKGIEMSDDFDGKMQDIEKPENEEDDSGESEEEEDLNKEMGETEDGADKLDDQIWGDDEDQEKDEDENEMNEEDDGKGTKDEKDSHNDLDTKNDAAKEDGKDEHDKDGLDATSEPKGDDKRKQQEKDIDDMKDPEVDEDQINPYHNELEEPPEAEEMDLGEMNNVDEEHDGDEQNEGENPFDIDKMKENMELPEETENENENTDDIEEENEEAKEANNSSDSEDDDGVGETEKHDENNVNEDEKQEEQSNEKDTEPDSQTRGDVENEKIEEEEVEKETENAEKPEEHEQSKDKSSKEDNVQSIPETENKGSADQVLNENEEDVKQEQKLDEQETGEEKDGVGQAENDENDGGHQGIAETKEMISKDERKNERNTKEKRKQGKTNEERSLGEAEQNKLKQLKTIDKLKEQKETESEINTPEDEDVAAEEYQHVKEPKKSDKTTLDNATEEQSKNLQHQQDKEDENEPECENNDELMEEDENENLNNEEDIHDMEAEKFDHKSEKPSKTEKVKERIETDEQMEIEGEVVETMNVPRGTDTTAHCISEILLDNSAQAQELTPAETLEFRKMYQQQIVGNQSAIPQHEDYETWQTISNRMSQNARDLCEQLRLILEPTKCTRLKGDYRTGRRINMKKIIPYIASQFRKDKIWLRRTKPAQRDYKITIAIDDSKSMHHNNSKTLTLEAISLVSQALTLLESGRLSIVSFGETPQIILNHTEQFDGPKLVNSLCFAQNETKIADLLDFIRTINTEESNVGSDNGLFENLLLILSDGHNIFREGKIKVKNAVKLARLQRIFLVYIIIDNPENKHSILDVQAMEMLPDKSVNIKSYMDDFPFPYYVIVRDLNQLPTVLSEAMRQWFELVNSEQ
ncbi:midasin [Teleopsis dalmanni]|uniref:midasin n=2 Tax=Teleopsis dalmanni TaxID=139649 RepID=UPI0018CEABC3|nr:midasin [Teleopsis dalmanni]